jgi:phage tail sheath protein FI
MSDFSSPDVRVRQISKGPLVLKGNSDTVGGFMGVATRGPVNTPTKVTSFKEAEDLFGPFRSDSDLMYALKDFFTAGGKFAYVSRVTGSSAAAAAISSSNGTGAIIDWDASFVGVLANGWTIQTIRKSVVVAEIPDGASLGTGAITSLAFKNAGRVRVGDLVRVRSLDGAETDTLTVTLTGVNIATNTVAFASRAPTGAITVDDPSDAVVDLFTFDVILRDASGVQIRTWKNLRMSPLSSNYFATVINSTFRTPLVAAINSAGAAALDLRPTDGTVTLTAGVDPTIIDGSYIGGGSGTGTGLNAFDGITDMDMLSIPGVFGTDNAVVKALLAHADLNRTYMAICEVPGDSTRTEAIDFATTEVNQYTAMAEGYWYPRIQVLDPLTGLTRYVSPTGYRQGVIAKTHRNRGTAKAAAGTVDGRILGATGVEANVSKADYDLLYPARVNAIRSIPGTGLCFMGNITLDPDESIIESSVAFYLLKLRKDLEAGLQWVGFELNNAKTRNAASRLVISRLKEDHRKGLLNGERESEAFFVVCDETNNGPEIQAARKLVMRVGVNVTHTAEFGDITLELDTRALDASLAQQG